MLFFYSVIELNYLNELGRFIDDMTSYLDEIKETKCIPNYFENNNYKKHNLYNYKKNFSIINYIENF